LGKATLRQRRFLSFRIGEYAVRIDSRRSQRHIARFFGDAHRLMCTPYDALSHNEPVILHTGPAWLQPD
jgi:hypothetical protein